MDPFVLQPASPQEMSSDANLSATAQVQRGISRAKGKPFRLALMDVDAPHSVEGLARDPILLDLLVRGVVFLHDKSPSSDRLLEVARSAVPSHVAFVDVPDVNQPGNLSEMLSMERQRRKKSMVFVVRARASHQSVEEIMNMCCSGRARLNGLWVLGFAADFSPHVLRLFDLLFAFGSSTSDLDRLRSVIPLPRKTEALPGDDTTVGDERAFVFFNTERPARQWAMRVTRNPVTIPLRAVSAANANTDFPPSYHNA